MNKGKEAILVACIFVLLLVFGLRKYLIDSEVDKEGVYVMGKVTETYLTSRGRVVKGWAKYKDEILHVNAKPGFDYDVVPGTRFLIKVLPDHPKSFNCITDKKVPPCFDKDEYIGHIWKEFPACDNSAMRDD